MYLLNCTMPRAIRTDKLYVLRAVLQALIDQIDNCYSSTVEAFAWIVKAVARASTAFLHCSHYLTIIQLLTHVPSIYWYELHGKNHVGSWWNVRPHPEIPIAVVIANFHGRCFTQSHFLHGEVQASDHMSSSRRNKPKNDLTPTLALHTITHFSAPYYRLRLCSSAIFLELSLVTGNGLAMDHCGSEVLVAAESRLWVLI